mgnify:CR=1 FL=1
MWLDEEKKVKIYIDLSQFESVIQKDMIDVEFGEYKCVIKIIDEENLKSRIKVSTKTLLVHGDSDQVVQPSFMLEAKDFFIRNNIKIETHLIKNCDHNIPIEASSIALNYILKKFS